MSARFSASRVLTFALMALLMTASFVQAVEELDESQGLFD
jgi:hypothetical protein